jgi:hypothetical protein
MSRYSNRTPFLTTPGEPGDYNLGAGNSGSEGMGTAALPALWQPPPLVSVSDGVYVEGHNYITYYFYFTDHAKSGNPDTLIVVPEVSEHGETFAGTAHEDWAPLQVEELALGVATQYNYKIEKTGISALNPPPDELYLGVSIPVRGFRWIRINVALDVGAMSAYCRFHLSGGPV